VGYTTISGTDQVMAIYSDDPTTSEIDGMLEGEEIIYRRYNINTANEELLHVVSGGDALDDCNYFSSNGISMMALKTSVESIETLADIKVYPNPATDYIRISQSESSGATQVILSDMIGNEIISTSLNAGEKTLDVSRLAEGCYLLRISTGNQIISKKVVIRK
jgi:hypothetical protein